MAMSNRDRVGRGFELLAKGLEPFVTLRMSVYLAKANVSDDWIAVLSAREANRGGPRTYNRSDPALLLRMITDERKAFAEALSRTETTFASELRDTRNRWAHNTPFSADDTYRALDTMERLLTAVGATEQAEEVRRLRVDHQRSTFEAETRRIVRQQDSGVHVASQGLRPWREVLAPHDDVATGNFSASEFAAHLHLVARGEGSPEYVDPVEFFRRTYLTEGLRDLLERAVRRITGDANASPVVNLQTNFGGGKTHSMLALWHLFGTTPASALGQDVHALLGGRKLPKGVRRVALVGQDLSVNGSVKPDGTEVRTMWGELAWQLGGRSGYDVLADADATSTSPGEVLRELIARHAPCLILIDEWVAYARQLWGREDLPAGTFDTQFTFAQALTEAVTTVPGALLVISIPASHDPERDGSAGSAGSALEVGGPNGQHALARLQNVVRRVADQWRPANAEESFEIVRRRLFTEPDAAALAEIAAAARQFAAFYTRHTGEFPREVTRDPARYEARIRASYPIHPELFDRLYEDWSTLERFQRTRGVLRLMSTVVHALWIAQDASPMILPGTVPLDAPTVVSEITQYLPDSWKPIVDADIDGPSSSPVQVDTARPTLGARAVTRRLARTIFVGSAPTLGSAHRGVDRQRVWLGTAVPGDTVGNFGSALDLLSQRATYLYSEGNRYWYDTHPSVTRTAADHADGLRERREEVWAEIVARLRVQARARGGFAAVHVAPGSTADVPDTEEARLVVLHPSSPHTRGSADSDAMRFARQAFETRGSGQRVNRNMLVFLAADSRRLEELDEATRAHLGWRWVRDHAEELDLSPQQARQVAANLERTGEMVDSRIEQTYHWALVPETPEPSRPTQISEYRAEGAASLAERVTDKLTRAGLLADAVAAPAIRIDLEQKLATVWQRGHVGVGELWAYFCRYPYLTRLRDRRVLDEGVLTALDSLTWQTDAFALATGVDEATGRYTGLVLPGGSAHFGQVTDSTLLVRPDLALAQVEADRAAEKASTGDTGGVGGAGGGPAGEHARPGGPGVTGTDQGGGPGTPATVTEVPERPHHTRFFGVYRVDPERYGRDLAHLGQEILAQLAAVDGAELEVTVEVHARRPDGFPDDKVRTVLENARALRFQQADFADD